MRGFGRRLRLLFQVGQYDKVFIHREATPIGPPWMEWAIAKLWKKPITFDFDDAIWLPNSSKANEKIAGKLKFHGKTAKTCSWATTVIAGNAFLADYARQFCDDVRIIPTTIDTKHHHNPDLFVLRGTKWVKKTEAASVEREIDEEPLAASHWPLADGLESDNPECDDKSDDVKQKIAAQSSTESHESDDELTANSRGNEQGSKTDKNVSPSKEGVAPTVGGDGGGNTEASQQSTKSPNSENQLEASSQQLKAIQTQNDPRKASEKTSDSSKTNLVTIGWTGTHSTLKQLTPLFPLLEEIHREIPFRFLLIADTPPDPLPPFVEFRKWKKETEIEDLLEIDMGIMPLYDTDWERGKCGFKALQYMALEKPAVISSVGVNKEIIENEKQGFLCEAIPLNENSEWKKALSSLLQNSIKRKEMGKAGRQRIIEAYSVQSQTNVYRQILS